MTHHLDLDTIVLSKGTHRNREDGVCLLEAVAWWAGERHSDHPLCVSPLLADFGIALNDRFGSERRQQLKPLIPLLPDTAGDGLDEARSYLALDWLIRTYVPAWLDLAGITDRARELNGLNRIADPFTVRTASPIVRHAEEEANAAWIAARAGAGDLTNAGADATILATWIAAKAATAAGVAAWAAARNAAWIVACAAVWDAFEPTGTMAVSIIDLYRCMIRPEAVAA